MNIHEYQAKRIFKDYGINVANGILVTNLNEAKKALNILQTNKFATKVQILTPKVVDLVCRLIRTTKVPTQSFQKNKDARAKFKILESTEVYTVTNPAKIGEKLKQIHNEGKFYDYKR